MWRPLLCATKTCDRGLDNNMGSFRAWLGDRQLNEILDLKAENFPDVRLIGHGDSYKSKFRSIDRDGTSNEYAAEFHLGGHSVNERDENYNIKYEITIQAWDISLYGPSGWELTHNANPMDVYGKLLYSIKLLFEKVDPKAIYFSPYEMEMALVYRRFFDKFLKDKFTLVYEGLFMRNDYLKSRSFNKEQKEFLKKKVEESKTGMEDQLKHIRATKASQRERSKRLLGAVGSILRTYYDGEYTPCLVVGVEGVKYKVVIINHGIPKSYLTQDYHTRPLDPNEIREYAPAIRRLVEVVRARYPEYRDLLEKPAVQRIWDVVYGRGTPPPEPQPGITIPPGLRDTGFARPLRPRRSRGPDPNQLALFQ